MNTPMSRPPPFDQAEHILTAALDHDPAEREAFLAAACGGDGAFRAGFDTLFLLHTFESPPALCRARSSHGRPHPSP